MQLTTRGRLLVGSLATAILAMLVQFTGPADAAAPVAVTAAAVPKRAATDCPAFTTYGLPAHPDYGSGCLDPSWPTRTHGMYGTLVNADVFVVGDSITTLCKTSITTRLEAAGLTWAVNYWSSRPTKIAVDFALSMSAPPAKLVMAMGTNDIFDPNEMAAQIQRLVTSPKFANTEIWWVDVQAARPATAAADQRNSMWVNRQVWTAGANVHVVEWASQFYNRPDRIGTYLQSDGVHPNDAGCEFWGENLYQWIS